MSENILITDPFTSPSGSDLGGDSSTGDMAESQVGTPKAGGVSPTGNYHKKFPLFSVILLIVLSVVSVIAIYLFLQVRELSMSQPVPFPTPSPVASIDPTASWKTMSTKYWTFKVPPELNYLECSTHDQILVGSPSAPSTMFDKDKIIECNFDQAGELIYVTHALDNSENNIVVPENIDANLDPFVSEVESIKVDGKEAIFQKETTSMGQGTGSRYKVYVHNGNYMNVITYNDLSMKTKFQQILSTFKFTENSEPTYTLKEISEACIAIHNSSKYWDAKYQECNDGGEDQTPLKTYCLKYGGTFVPDGSTCRHAKEEGLPCGPELSFFCSF